MAFSYLFVSLAGAAIAQGASGPKAAAAVDIKAAPRRMIRFAVIGDYGLSGAGEAAVASMVKSAGVDFIITVGDNNYEMGEASTIDANIGQYYSDFIYPYTGAYGPGASENRFWPSLGNHDWYTPGAAPYLSYFTLPGNERYYDFRRGPVHFFSLDGDPNEPDGVLYNSTQAAWLQGELAASAAPFKIVYNHFPPFSSSEHGPQIWMQWPFKQWGASAVLAGHEHVYERLFINGAPHFIQGNSGKSLYQFIEAVSGSQMRFNADLGALLVEADDNAMIFRHVTRKGNVVDMYTLTQTTAGYQETPIVSFGSVWKYLDNGSNQGASWKLPSFHDATWASGPAQLGYGEGDEATVVSYGPNASQKYITTYFRQLFNVTNPAAYSGLLLRLRRDDGAVIYINGAEVYRSNMPSGSISYLTLASDGVSDLQEFATYGTWLPASALAAGSNLIAVEIHQSSASSSDVSFDAQLAGLSLDTKIINKGAVWKYWDSGAAPAGEWKSVYYNDVAWSAGPAPLGYGDGDEATVVGYGANPNNKHVTTYFRRAFEVADASAFGTVLLRILRDDGAIVYLNGREVYRTNLPLGDVVNDTLAGSSVSGAEESLYTETSIDPCWLATGRNVLAVEVHQAAPDSSDISFDLQLVAY